MIFVNTNGLRDMTTEAPRAVVHWFIELIMQHMTTPQIVIKDDIM